ncbi:MAG: PD-(D/E)XK nuclease family protein, partial [Desulfomonile tiedjei]|nr:PD-(D/E)XK nuclease family protein [Desulfomonile tiedjei]
MRQARLNRFTDTLGRTCQQYMLKEKWIIAPSLRVGHQWLDTVTCSGQAVINARVKTLKGMALDLAGPELARLQVRLVSDRGASIIIDRILNRLRKESPAYVTKMAASQSLSLSVYSSIKDIRLAGLRADDLVSHQFEHPDKASELSFIMAEYLSTLAQSGLIDYADALEMAVCGLAGSTVASDDVVVITADDLELTAKEEALIKALPSETLLQITVDQPLTEIESRSEPLTNAGLLRWLPDPTRAPVANEADDTASIFSAVGEVNEIREVFRRVLSKAIALDDVEILHTDKNTYVPLIYELCSRFVSDFHRNAEPIVTFAEGIPTTYSRPGRALMGWVSWVREGFLQSTLARMVEDRIVSLPDSGLEAAGFESLAAVFRSLGIGFGRDRYLPKIDELIAGLEMRLAAHVPAALDDDSLGDRMHYKDYLETASVLRRLLEAMLDLTPDSAANPTDILDSAAKFLESFARRIDESDGYAFRALVDEIRDMARYVNQENGEDLSLDVWEWLASLPGEVRIMGSGPRPGRVHVSNVLTGGHSGRRHFFIVGLDDGRFPGSGYQDPVVLDTERRKLSDRLVTTTERLAAKLGGFSRLLSRHRGSLTFSFSCKDILDDREMFPSPVLISAFRIVSGTREGDQRDLLQWLPRPASFAPDDPAKSLDETEWWLSRLCAADAIADPDKLIATHFPHLGRGLEAAKHRKGSDFTIYDGMLRTPGAELDPAASAGPIMSGSMLETAGRCPLAYFFRYVIDIRLPEDYQIDPERWLDPLQFGNLLHEVFYTFAREVSGDHWPPSFENDLPRLKEILSETASRYRELYPPASEDAFLDQLRELNSAAQVFLREEELMTDRFPAYLEVSAGLAPYEKGSALDTRNPVRVQLPDGRVIRMRGRLDRLDRIGSTNNYAIVDYKTGSASKYEDTDPFRNGRVVQHALYTAMAGEILKAKLGSGSEVTQFEYLFPGSRGQGLRL